MLKFASISALAALAAAASALAAGPTLSVSATTSEYSAAASTIIRFEDTGQDPTASMDVFAPAGFGVDVGQPIGSTIGALDGHISTATSADTRVTGLIKNADPVTNPGTGCAPDRPVHDAVWTVNLNAGGATLGRLALYVDQARRGLLRPHPACSTTRRRRDTACFAHADGERPLTNPAAAGEYRWTTILRTHSRSLRPRCRARRSSASLRS